ncbi:MAG: hypothetical protein H6728_06145 [Myxococcales bacterium]|nr:hypothetical protein [Myxococcales bacterium]MCB9642639.1 hypothetical protein [Myxococcales bacterium]
MDVSYYKKAAFVRAEKQLCTKKAAKIVIDAIQKLHKYKGELYEIKPAKVKNPAVHLMQRKLVRKPKPVQRPSVRHPAVRRPSVRVTKQKKDQSL